MPEARMIAGITPAREVKFVFDGCAVQGFEGEGLAAALLRAGIGVTRRTPVMDAARGYYCGMGQCWDCVAEVEGLGFVRGCQHPVSEGMVVRRAQNWTQDEA